MDNFKGYSKSNLERQILGSPLFTQAIQVEVRFNAPVNEISANLKIIRLSGPTLPISSFAAEVTWQPIYLFWPEWTAAAKKHPRYLVIVLL